MFAIIAAILFAIAFIMELAGAGSGHFTSTTVTTLGLVFLALHFAPLAGVRSRRWRR